MFSVSTCYYFWYLRGVEDWVTTLILGDPWETKEQSEEVIRANINYTFVVKEEDDEVHKQM